LITFALAIVPAIINVWTNQNQLKLNTETFAVSNDSPGIYSLLNGIQFVFRMKIYRKIKRAFIRLDTERQSSEDRGMISRRILFDDFPISEWLKCLPFKLKMVKWTGENHLTI
jgi:hypothetical protein